MDDAADSFAAVIAAWPDNGALAADLAHHGVNAGRVAVWKHRSNIPPEYWPDLVRAAAARGLTGVTLERLAGLAARRLPVPPAPAPEAAA